MENKLLESIYAGLKKEPFIPSSFLKNNKTYKVNNETRQNNYNYPCNKQIIRSEKKPMVFRKVHASDQQITNVLHSRRNSNKNVSLHNVKFNVSLPNGNENYSHNKENFSTNQWNHSNNTHNGYMHNKFNHSQSNQNGSWYIHSNNPQERDKPSPPALTFPVPMPITPQENRNGIANIPNFQNNSQKTNKEKEQMFAGTKNIIINKNDKILTTTSSEKTLITIGQLMKPQVNYPNAINNFLKNTQMSISNSPAFSYLLKKENIKNTTNLNNISNVTQQTPIYINNNITNFNIGAPLNKEDFTFTTNYKTYNQNKKYGYNNNLHGSRKSFKRNEGEIPHNSQRFKNSFRGYNHKNYYNNFFNSNTQINSTPNCNTLPHDYDHEILNVNIKLGNENKRFILNKYDDYFQIAQKFCKENNISQEMAQCLYTKFNTVITNINEVFNKKLTNLDVEYLNSLNVIHESQYPIVEESLKTSVYKSKYTLNVSELDKFDSDCDSASDEDSELNISCISNISLTSEPSDEPFLINMNNSF